MAATSSELAGGSSRGGATVSAASVLRLPYYLMLLNAWGVCEKFGKGSSHAAMAVARSHRLCGRRYNWLQETIAARRTRWASYRCSFTQSELSSIVERLRLQCLLRLFH